MLFERRVSELLTDCELKYASYAIALFSVSDKHHEQALTLAREIEIDPTIRLVTTRAVLLEIGNALARQKYRSIAVQLLDSLENDSTVSIIPLSEALCAAAMHLFQARADKGWGTDGLRFICGHARASDSGRVDCRRSFSAGRLSAAAARIEERNSFQRGEVKANPRCEPWSTVVVRRWLSDRRIPSSTVSNSLATSSARKRKTR